MRYCRVSVIKGYAMMAKQLQLPTKEHIPNSTETAFNHQLPIKPPSHVRTIAGTQDLQKTTIRQDLENKHHHCYTQNTDRKKKSRLNKSGLNSPKPRVPILGLAQTVSSDSPVTHQGCIALLALMFLNLFHLHRPGWLEGQPQSP